MNQTRAFKILLPMAVLLTLAVYLSGLNGAFIYDDYQQVVNRAQLHNIFHLRDVIFCGLRQNRLLQNLSLALNWTIAPEQTWSFKVFSLTLHLVNGSLLFLWLKRVFKENLYLPAVTTAFFLIHPLQIQSVSYVMGVNSLFQGFFYLLSLYWYSKYSLTRLPGLVLILTASLFAKETCALIPLLLLGYEILVNQTSVNALPKLKWLGLLLLPLLYLPIYAVLKDPSSMYAGTTGFKMYPFFQYISAQLYFLIFYLFLFLNPSLQSIIHGNPAFGAIPALLEGISTILLVSVSVYFVRTRKSGPRTAFFIFFFMVSYLPTNSFFQMINPFAEYRLYLSSISLCLLLAWGTQWVSARLSRSKNLTHAELTLPGFLLILFSMFTFQNVMIWKSGVKIFTQAIKRYPTNHEIYASLAVQYVRVNDLKSGFFYFSQSRFFGGWLTQDLAKNYYIIAALYCKEGDFSRAWYILRAMQTDKGKDPLPTEFFTLYNEVEKNMKERGLSLKTSFDDKAGEENNLRIIRGQKG